MLSKRITYLRKKAGMSQYEVSKLINVAASTVGMYEQGRRIPDLNVLIAMSDVFEVSLDYLITGSESPYSGNALANRYDPDCPCSTCYWKKMMKF